MDYLQYFFVKGFIRHFLEVLNLIINGLPSIPLFSSNSFPSLSSSVLNLIINGLPSIHLRARVKAITKIVVLNLIINGLPSILKRRLRKMG